MADSTAPAATSEPHLAPTTVKPGATRAHHTGAIWRWAIVLGGGLLIGCVAGLLMIMVFALLRWGPGISPPPESIPDRLAPSIKIHDFFKLINDYGGYNGLKRFGVWTGIRAMMGASAAVGVIYAAVAEVARRRNVGTWHGIRRWNLWFVAVALIAVWLGSIIFLWPVLWSNYRGLPPTYARPVTMLGLLIGYGSLAVALLVGHRVLFGRPDPVSDPEAAIAPARPFAFPLPRRAVLTGITGGILGFASYRIIRHLEDQAVFSYDGTRPRGKSLDAITPVEKFYVVTKNVIDPQVSKSVWRLKVYGHVDNESTYDFDALAAMPVIDQETTLCCISNGVGDILMSNAVWTGIPLHTLLDSASVKSGAVEAALHAVDGYTDTIPIEVATDPNTLLAFKMNGQELPHRHGYPARLIVPGYFGEKNLKWITGVEIVDKPVRGFYEHQGWGPSFIIPTRSLFYVPEFKNPFKVGSTVNLRGIAFGGNRGITSVDVSLDDGKTWLPAKIDYPGTKLTWSLWSHPWVPTGPGEFFFQVRATDGNGDLQTPEKRSIVSEGATGYHRIKVRVSA
jgi:DMSO/TMAO reductase YedYZ molybdopterin-dependent catalytic subunit